MGRLMGIAILWIMAVILFERNRAEAERARAFQQLAETNETLAALTKVTTNAVSTLELNDLLSVLLQRLVEVMQADVAAISLRENEHLMVRASVGIEAGVETKYSIPIGQGFAGTIAQTLKPLYIADAQTDERVKSPFIKERGIRSLLGVPLKRNGTLVGVIHMAWLEPHPRSEKDLHLLEITAERCAMAILNAQLYEKSKFNEERYQRLVELSPDAILVYRGNRIDFVNAAGLKLFGASRPDQLVGKSYTEILSPDCHAIVAERIREALEEGKPAPAIEETIIRVDGTLASAEVTTAPVTDQDGKALLVDLRDITERKQAEGLVRESESRYRSLVEDSPDIIGIFQEHQLQFINAAGVRLLGANTREDLLGRTGEQLIHPEDRPQSTDRMRRRLAGETGMYPAEVRYVRLDGTPLPVEVSATSITFRGKPAVQFIARDITARKQAEERLELFRNLIDQTDDAIEVLDLETGRFLDMNETGCRDLGYSREEVLSLTVFDVDPTLDPVTFRQGNEELRKNGSLLWEGLHRRKNGSTFPVEINIRYAKLDRAYILAVVRDITERKRTQAQLQLQSTALAAAANAIVITDREGVIEWANDAFTNFTGYTLAEAVGKKPGQLLKSGKHDQAFFRNLWETILAGKVWHGEMVNRRKDGGLYSEDMTITPLKNEAGAITHFIAVKQDVTERKVLESQLRQAQKMEAIGQLAGGVAHDFNNMLAVIRGNAELLLMDADQFSGPNCDGLKQINAAADRAANLTRQLLAFSRKQVMQFQPADLNDVIVNLTKMLKRIIGEHIELQCTYSGRLPFVRADVGTLEQVLMNLVVNARDAMPKGGKLILTTESVHLSEGHASEHSEACTGDFVRLSVSDNGTGIAPEHLPHIFDPFFTTKEAGKGTGLGLATVHGIVKQHGGWVEVSSRVGTGTAFNILLPAIASPTEPAATTPEPPLRCGNETILLVEDDQAVRLLTRRVLESFGYRVEAAASGREALELWKTRGAQIDLLLTDMVMPGGVTGRELAEQLRAQKPGLKVIYTSGYSAAMAGQDIDFIQRTKSHFLQKPCPTRVLIRTVRECLDEK